MKTDLVFRVVVGIVLVVVMCGECGITFAAEKQTSSDAYDSITWQDVNKKREARDEGNFFTRTYWWMFKRHKEQTYQGDEIDVLQTASNVDLGSNDSPVRFVHVTSDK